MFLQLMVINISEQSFFLENDRYYDLYMCVIITENYEFILN